MRCDEVPFTAALAGFDDVTTVDLTDIAYENIVLSPSWSLRISDIVENGWTANISPVEDGCPANYKVVSKSLNGCAETIEFTVTEVLTNAALVQCDFL